MRPVIVHSEIQAGRDRGRNLYFRAGRACREFVAAAWWPVWAFLYGVALARSFA